MSASAPVLSEKVEQQQIINLVRSLGGRPFVLGRPSPNDGRRHRGTGQTPGIADVYAFVPTRGAAGEHLAVWVEVKRRGGRLRPEQEEFRGLCASAGVAHVVGGLDEFIVWLVHHGLIKPESLPHYRQPRGVAS